MRALWHRLADLLLTTDPAGRIRLAQVGLAMLMLGTGVLVMRYVVWLGAAHAGWVNWWTVLSLGGLALFFLAIRSGVSRRFADPSLALPQMVFGVAVAAAAYVLAGPMRGGVLPVLIVVLAFGMFQFRPRAIARMAVFTLLVFGAVMALMAWRSPHTHRPAVELGHFLMLVATVPAVSVLAGRLTRLRDRLRQQKADLERALARIQELATRDELTGLVNRRHMLQLLEQERQRSVRSGRTFCVALIDIDHFKRVNDAAGHAVGDEVLCAFAREASAAIRLSDVLARWGGDEFVLMLTDAHATIARTGVERLRERVAALGVDAGGQPLRFTVSAGLTEHIAGETVSQALERADRALYEAKAQGRDRVVVA